MSVWLALTLEKINVAHRFVNKIAQGLQRLSRSQRGAARKVRAGWRQIFVSRGGSDMRSALAGVDFADPAAVLSEIGGDIVLPVTSRDHAFNDRYFRVCKSHFVSPVMPLFGGCTFRG